MSGRITGSLGETWLAVNNALRRSGRGLDVPPGMSLVRLLLEERGVRNKAHAPKLKVRQIVGWARDHHARRESGRPN